MEVWLFDGARGLNTLATSKRVRWEELTPEAISSNVEASTVISDRCGKMKCFTGEPGCRSGSMENVMTDLGKKRSSDVSDLIDGKPPFAHEKACTSCEFVSTGTM